MTPSAPVRNCARQITPSGLELLTQELYQAWELTENGRYADLTTPPPLHRRHAAWAGYMSGVSVEWVECGLVPTLS